MNVRFVAAALLLVVLAGAGWPGARLAARTPAWAVVATPAVAGLVVAFGVMASVLTRTSLVPWLALPTVVGWSVLAARRGRDDHFFDSDAPGGGVALMCALVALMPVVLVDLPAVESDARFIWWFHAAWFRGGGAVARQGLANPSFGPTHPGYPPVLPGVVAAVWQLGAAYDREVAMRVSQMVTASFIAAVGFFVSGLARVPRRGALAIAALVVAACWGANPRVGLSGFADLAWAAAFVVAAALLLAGPVDRRTIVTGALFAGVAALTKFEGGAAAVLLVGACAWRGGRQWRRAIPVVLTVGGGLAAWVVVSTVTDVPTDDRGDWSALAEVLDRGSVVHQRFVDTLGNIAGELGALVGLGVAAVLAMVLLGRLARTPLRQPGLLAILVLGGAYVVFLAAVVAIAPLPLSEYTDSGNYRTVLVVRVLVLVDVVLAAVAALRALGLVSSPTGSGTVRADRRATLEDHGAPAGGAPVPAGLSPTAIG